MIESIGWKERRKEEEEEEEEEEEQGEKCTEAQANGPVARSCPSLFLAVDSSPLTALPLLSLLVFPFSFSLSWA